MKHNYKILMASSDEELWRYIIDKVYEYAFTHPESVTNTKSDSDDNCSKYTFLHNKIKIQYEDDSMVGEIKLFRTKE